jgi:hypothetical protein
VDEFLVHQWWLAPKIVRDVIVEQARARTRPVKTPREILAAIHRVAPAFAELAGEGLSG